MSYWRYFWNTYVTKDYITLNALSQKDFTFSLLSFGSFTDFELVEAEDDLFRPDDEPASQVLGFAFGGSGGCGHAGRDDGPASQGSSILFEEDDDERGGSAGPEEEPALQPLDAFLEGWCEQSGSSGPGAWRTDVISGILSDLSLSKTSSTGVKTVARAASASLATRSTGLKLISLRLERTFGRFCLALKIARLFLPPWWLLTTHLLDRILNEIG